MISIYIIGFIVCPIFLILMDKKFPRSMYMEGQELIAITITAFLWPIVLIIIFFLLLLYWHENG